MSQLGSAPTQQDGEKDSSLSLLAAFAKLQAEVERMKLMVQTKKAEEFGYLALPGEKIGQVTKAEKADLELEVYQKTVGASSQAFGKAGGFYKICLTGGPCGGKTTAIDHLTEKLKERGYQVFVVPEAASMIFSSGASIDLGKYTDAEKIKFQYYLLVLQMMMEDVFIGIASTTKSDKIVVIMDRGLMDGSAYLSDELWQALLNEYDLNEARLRDQRYDLVIHMCSAAKGAEEFYTLANNSARHESLDDAVFLDDKLEQAWIKHPNYTHISSKDYKDFKGKLEAVLMKVFSFMGEPLGTALYEKFMISNPEKKLVPLLEKRYGVKVTRCEIEDFIFYGEGEIRYFRKRVR